jgi:phage terminase large subunit-like protein
LRNDLLACENVTALENFWQSLNAEELDFLHYDWHLWAREDQLPPPVNKHSEAWTTWLVLGGRGAGKTRTGSEWIRSIANASGPLRIALVGETLEDVRSVMIEGVSGLLAVHPETERPRLEASKRRLVWPNGTIAQLFSANDPASLRGPQFHAAWCDEVCKWRYPQKTWDMLQFGLRLGEQPQQIVTTTPRAINLLEKLLISPTTVVSRAKTVANIANLSPVFLETVVNRYRGTRLGRQELDGEILHDLENALWRRDALDKCRIEKLPQLQRVIIAIDPPVSSTQSSDACGIIVAGRDEQGQAYVIADLTAIQARPLEWARKAIAGYHYYEADSLVAEVNQGGEMVETIIHQVDSMVPLKNVHATRGKWLRAEPVAALYDRGNVFHVGQFPELEDEMCNFTVNGRTLNHSPDRLDALVWAITELMLDVPATPRVRNLI